MLTNTQCHGYINVHGTVHFTTKTQASQTQTMITPAKGCFAANTDCFSCKHAWCDHNKQKAPQTQTMTTVSNGCFPANTSCFSCKHAWCNHNKQKASHTQTMTTLLEGCFPANTNWLTCKHAWCNRNGQKAGAQLWQGAASADFRMTHLTCIRGVHQARMH